MNPRQAPAPHVINFDSREIPDLANWKPGQRYRIVLEVEQQNYHLNADNSTSASFNIISARPQYGGQGKANARPPKSATMGALQQKADQS